MNPVRLWCLAAFLALAGVAWGAAANPTPQISAVMLMRTPCDDGCPGYTVVIASDGTVTFNGRAWVAQLGVVSKRVSVSRLTPLFQRLQAINFWSIDGRADGREVLANGDIFAGFPPGLPTYTITVVQGGRSRQVQGIVGMQYPEGDLADLIDQAADIADWIRFNGEAVPPESVGRLTPSRTPEPTPVRLPEPALALAEPSPKPPAFVPIVLPAAPSRPITPVVVLPGNSATVYTPGEAPTVVMPLANSGSVLSTPGQPLSTLLSTPGGGSTLYTPGQSLTIITPISGGGSIINTPGQPPSTMVPNAGGGSTIYTPGEAPTMVVPLAGGGSMILAPGQPPVTVMPTP
jgi:hypothetical protein